VIASGHPQAPATGLRTALPIRRRRSRFPDLSGEVPAQVELVADDLFEFVRDTRDIDLDLSKPPFTVRGFYTLLDFPAYLAERATGELKADSVSSFDPEEVIGRTEQAGEERVEADGDDEEAKGVGDALADPRPTR